MSEAEIREFIERLYSRYKVVPISKSMQIEASRLRERYSLSHWDSLIVSAALESGATNIITEDMQDGLVIDSRLTIFDPFG